MYQPFNIYYDIYSDNASSLPNLFTLRVQQCRYYPSWTWHPQHDSRLVRFGSLLFTSRLLGCQRVNGWMDGSGGAAKAVGARGCLWLDWHAPAHVGIPNCHRPTHRVTHSNTSSICFVTNSWLRVHPVWCPACSSRAWFMFAIEFLDFFFAEVAGELGAHTWPVELAKRSAAQISSFSGTLASRAR